MWIKESLEGTRKVLYLQQDPKEDFICVVSHGLRKAGSPWSTVRVAQGWCPW